MRNWILITLSLLLLGCSNIEKEYHTNGGLKSEMEYKKNIPNGYYKYYDRRGNLIEEGTHLDAEKEGLCLWFYPDGTIKTKANFKSGLEHGSVNQYFPSGQLQDSAIFDYGTQEGITYSYFEDGSIDRETEFKNGKQNGIFKSYFPNGQLEFSALMKDNRASYYIEFDSLGNVIDEFKKDSTIQKL